MTIEFLPALDALWRINMLLIRSRESPVGTVSEPLGTNSPADETGFDDVCSPMRGRDYFCWIFATKSVSIAVGSRFRTFRRSSR